MDVPFRFKINDACYIMSYIRSVGLVQTNSQAIMSNIYTVYSSTLYMDMLFQFLNYCVKEDSSEKIVMKEPINKIDIKELSFSYNGKTKVLDKINLTLVQGEKVALVGPNGSGKSTFLKILAGLYNIEEGEILINGRSLKDLDIRSYRSKMSVLFQDFVKYELSLRENIGFGDIQNLNNDEKMVQMLNIAICDDDIQTTGQIEMMIQKIAKRNFADVDIEVFWNGESLADSVVAGDGYDIIYLDIEMNNEDGISTAKRIRKYDKNVLIIYVTSHENYMKESFSVRPFQFLVKPVSEKQMETCFMVAYEDINSGDFYFRYSYQRMNHKVLIRDILYFESSKRKVFIVTREETFEFYGKLNEIENSLKVCKISFLRVHQSFLVNYKHIKGQSYDFVVMDNGKKISISEDRRKLISEQYCSMEDTYYVDR